MKRIVVKIQRVGLRGKYKDGKNSGENTEGRIEGEIQGWKE